MFEYVLFWMVLSPLQPGWEATTSLAYLMNPCKDNYKSGPIACGGDSTIATPVRSSSKG